MGQFLILHVAPPFRVFETKVQELTSLLPVLYSLSITIIIINLESETSSEKKRSLPSLH